LEDLLKQILGELTSMKGELTSVKGELSSFRKEVDQRLGRLEEGKADLEQGQAKLEQGQAGLESQVSENTQILKALEHKAEVHKASMDSLTHQMAKLSGEVKSIKEDIKDMAVFKDMVTEHEISIRMLKKAVNYF